MTSRASTSLRESVLTSFGLLIRFHKFSKGCFAAIPVHSVCSLTSAPRAWIYKGGSAYLSTPMSRMYMRHSSKCQRGASCSEYVRAERQTANSDLSFGGWYSCSGISSFPTITVIFSLMPFSVGVSRIPTSTVMASDTSCTCSGWCCSSLGSSQSIKKTKSCPILRSSGCV